MVIHIDNRQTKYTPSLSRIRKTAQAALDVLASPDAELSIVLVNDSQIAVLNREYLDRKGPTNVIAFPMQEGAFKDIAPHLLGDVVVSLDTAAREAQTAGLELAQRLDELLVHGILHLFGYDHETDARDAAAMDQKSDEILAQTRPNTSDQNP